MGSSQVARGIRLARVVVEVSKGSDAKDPDYLGAGGTWSLDTDLPHSVGRV